MTIPENNVPQPTFVTKFSHNKTGALAKMLQESSGNQDQKNKQEQSVTINDSADKNQDQLTESIANQANQSVENAVDDKKQQEELENNNYKEKWLERFNTLTQRNNQIETERRTSKEELEKLQEERSSLDAISKDPAKLLEHFGYDTGDVVNRLLGIEDDEVNGNNQEKANLDPRMDKIMQMVEEMTQREKEREEKQKQQLEEQKKQEETQRIESFKGHIKSEIESQIEKYTAINSYDNVDNNVELVFDVIAAYADQTGQLMDVHEAAQMVEMELVDRIKKTLGTQVAQKLLGSQNKQEQSNNEPRQSEPPRQEIKPIIKNGFSSSRQKDGSLRGFLSDKKFI